MNLPLTALVTSKPWAPVAVFLVGLGVAAGAGLLQLTDAHHDAQVRFDHSVQAVVEHVGLRLHRPIYGLQGARGLFAASPRVDRAAFRAYVKSRDMARDFVGVRGFGFIQRVLRPDLATFIAAERADGAPQFALRQLADADHDDFYIIKFIEPAANNAGAQGLDIGSEPNRRAAAQRAIDTGEPTITAAITLVQDQRKTPGVLLFLPVYAIGAPPVSVAERRAALRGLVYAPLVMDELLGGMSDTQSRMIDFELFDGPAGTPGATQLFDADQHTANPSAAAPTDQSPAVGRYFSTTQTFTLGGRDLVLRINSTAAFDAGIDHTTPWVTFLVGVLLSVLTAALMRQQATGRQRAESLALKMTHDLRAEIAAHEQTDANRALAEEKSQAHLEELQLQKFALDQHAIVAYTDVQGKVLYVNDKFTEISGYSREELMGQDHIMLNSGVHPHGFFKAGF